MFGLCGGPRLFAAALMLVFAAIGTFADSSLRFASAQEEMSSDFREILSDDGQWVTHPRWGEVWVPAATREDWRPYLLGHWVYTDEWGWYWLADGEWVGITYDSGRWVLDRDYGLGWIWVPGTQWSPAWVNWRQDDEVIGWAPMPPDEIYPDVQDDPDFWVFVRASDIVAPAIAVVVLPAPQAVVFVSRTTIMSGTRVIKRNGRAIVANPGVPPSLVAARIGRPIEAVSVLPRVLHSTARGITIGGSHDRAVPHEIVTPRAKLIQPPIDTPISSHTSQSRPPIEFQRNQRDQNQSPWGAVHQPPALPRHSQSSGAIYQLPREALPGPRNHRSQPKQHAGPQPQQR